ncbi:MAG: molybdopterin converting factor subunit 1 [Gemmataceae bacterium]|nr:molybdopterin converting factor subunit 1 [Gemmata sp.]MDW8198292.1 molybdopterin converting factor subunit 1 [Gemmataceae bacterium]
MVIRVKLFAAMREFTGSDSLDIALPPGATVAQLRRQLATQWPQTQALLMRSAIAVNHDFANNDQVLQATDEVAVIPPVSGG